MVTIEAWITYVVAIGLLAFSLGVKDLRAWFARRREEKEKSDKDVWHV